MAQGSISARANARPAQHPIHVFRREWMGIAALHYGVSRQPRGRATVGRGDKGEGSARARGVVKI